MKRTMRTALSIAVTGWLIASIPPTAAFAGQTSQPVVLLPPPGYQHTWLKGINDDGIVIGSATLPQSLAPARALRWNLAGELTELDGLGGRFHDAHAINRRGDVVGYSQRPDGYVRAVRWDSQGGVHDLGVLAGDVNSIAYDVNDAGTVIGVSSPNETQVEGSTAVLWDSAGRLTVLDAPPGARSVIGLALNRHSEAIGTYFDSTGANRAVRWDRAGRATALANLGGDRDEVVGLADDGTAVGMVYGNTHRELAVRWDRAGRLTSLAEEAQVLAIAGRGGSVVGRLYAGGAQRWDYRRGGVVDLLPPSGDASASAGDVNGHGVAVGAYDRSPDGDTAAVRWDRAGRPTPLPTPADHERAWAEKISDRGDVAGGAYRSYSSYVVVWPRHRQG
ncbi:hypothetical protein [Lentzea sp. NEAU-D7]|uniref:hypothetical protein n=1 Tax=Lentzea sp. NEAU-D7 TaxID=2994667 RepID=UPI00224B360B|nr:hypothetical protein [Lentzea sp. NEAU-D7]MCX2951397.1 hypothetical protein [Lentzea sp. NEAU-D7]